MMAAADKKETLTDAFQHFQTLAEDSSYAHNIPLRAQPMQARQLRLAFLPLLDLTILRRLRYFRRFSIVHLHFVDTFD